MGSSLVSSFFRHLALDAFAHWLCNRRDGNAIPRIPGYRPCRKLVRSSSFGHRLNRSFVLSCTRGILIALELGIVFPELDRSFRSRERAFQSKFDLIGPYSVGSNIAVGAGHPGPNYGPRPPGT